MVNRILQVTADPESSLDKLAAIVEAEVGLSASVIKMANSPFFGLSREVSSISHALAVLGMEEVRNMVLAKVMFNTFTSYRKKGDMVNSLWRHSFYSALAAATIAENMGHDDNGLFVAGLIHDIGKLVIFLAFSRESLEKIYGKTENLDDSKKEIAYLGLNHEDLGRLLIKSWLFPETLQMAVGYHHCPESAPAHQLYPWWSGWPISWRSSTSSAWRVRRAPPSACPFLIPLAGLFAEHGLPLTAATIKELFRQTEKAFAQADDLVALLR